MTSEESVTLFSEGNSAIRKSASIPSEISFLYSGLVPAPLSLDTTGVMMAQSDAAKVPDLPLSASWQQAAITDLSICLTPVMFLGSSVVHLLLQACSSGYFQSWIKQRSVKLHFSHSFELALPRALRGVGTLPVRQRAQTRSWTLKQLSRLSWLPREWSSPATGVIAQAALVISAGFHWNFLWDQLTLETWPFLLMKKILPTFSSAYVLRCYDWGLNACWK